MKLDKHIFNRTGSRHPIERCVLCSTPPTPKPKLVKICAFLLTVLLTKPVKPYSRVAFSVPSFDTDQDKVKTTPNLI